MSNFLFYDDIKQYLTEEEQTNLENNGQFFVTVGAYWTKSPNMDYDPNDPNSQRTLNIRTLNINFKNVSLDALDDIEKAGLAIWRTSAKLGRFHGENPNGTYNFTYNCKRENDKAWNIMMKAVAILQQYYRQPIIDEIKRQVNQIPENGEIENVERLANEKWIKMVQDLGNGETNELIERFIEIFGKVYEWHYGHKLTFNNAKLILSQKPDATLIFTAYDWKRLYNHVPRDGAKPITYWAPYSNKRNVDNNFKKQKERADVMGIQFDKGYEHSTQSKNALAMEVSDLYGDYLPVHGYDVSDVVPLTPEDAERLQNTYGFINNLTGEMNQLTSDYVDSLGAKEGKEKRYESIRNLINDNAKLLYLVLVENLEKDPKTEQLAIQYGRKAHPSQKPDFSKLLPNLVRNIVDNWLEDEYKVKKAGDRVKARERITGMVLYFCGVWDANALAAVRGGNVTKEEAAHYSTIINRLLTLLDEGKKVKVKELRDLIKFPEGEERKVGTVPETNTTMNENIINEQVYCTPEKLVQMLDLQLIPSDGQTMTDDEFNQKRNDNMAEMYEMLQRINNLSKKPLYF